MSFSVYQPEGVALFENLAREQLLLDMNHSRPVLMLWRGPSAVVMGKNQNPWRECDPFYLREQDISLARRISGGGAVYHDPGNLNFCWILPREGYSPSACHDIVRRALNTLGLRADVAPTGGVLVQGKKVSGSAYCYRRERVLHHGTLLLEADLPRLRAALSPPRVRVETHAVRSVPAQVANLRRFLPGLRREELVRALTGSAAETLGAPESMEFEFPDLRPAADALRSAEWIWDGTPRFSVHFCLAHRQVELSVRQGKVERLTVDDEKGAAPSGRFCTPEWFAALAESLGVGEAACRAALAARGFHEIQTF